MNVRPIGGVRGGSRVAWVGVLACAVVVAACVGPTGAKPPSRSPASRRFRMGFTPFPHDMTVEAIGQVGKFVRDNGDIVAGHFEGVPWAEASTVQPFHKEMLNNWQRHKDARAPGGKLYLALTPINNDRSALAAYRRDREGLPLPAAFVGKGLDDPLVMDAYLRYCRRAIRYFQPDYLAVGIEVNELYHKAKAKWPAYVRLHLHVYKHLKRDHPKLPVFATFTLHNMLNAGWSDRREMLAAFKRLMPYNDMVAVSFYPCMAQLSAKTDACLKWLTRQFDAFDKPYAFVETGQPAEPVDLKSLKLTLPGGEQLQHRVVANLLGFARARPVEFVIWFVPRDYDALWEPMKNTGPEFFKVWRDCGLLDGEGKPRPACKLWQKTHKLPYRPR